MSRFPQKLFCNGVELIGLEAANERQMGVSAAADSCQIVCGGRILERLEGRVLLEALGQVLGSLCVEAVVAETANESRV